MNSFERTQVSTLVQRLGEEPRQIIACLGRARLARPPSCVRRWEKSVLEAFPLAVDEPDSSIPRPPFDTDETTFPVPMVQRDTAWMVRNWEAARREAGRSGKFVLAFDEIQKIPHWSETVKGLWDADRASGCPLHVVILGSAPLLMQSGLSESLAGRYESIHVRHWSFVEMSRAFNFDLPTYLYFGGYPGAAPFVRYPERWRDYILDSLVGPTIKRDILAMTRVDKPVLLRRLFELGCTYSGQILSYTKMTGQLQDAGNTTTLAHYLDLLSGAGMLTGLQKYSGSTVRVRASSPNCRSSTRL